MIAALPDFWPDATQGGTRSDRVKDLSWWLFGTGQGASTEDAPAYPALTIAGGEARRTFPP